MHLYTVYHVVFIANILCANAACDVVHVTYRSLFDRVTSLRLPAKRIKFLFDRYIAFETTHGSDDSVNAVRQKAHNYAEPTEPS